jgi:hypothetical protein
MNTTNELIAWLMDGDPAIRWQTMRDLQSAPTKSWQAEQSCCTVVLYVLENTHATHDSYPT